MEEHHGKLYTCWDYIISAIRPQEGSKGGRLTFVTIFPPRNCAKEPQAPTLRPIKGAHLFNLEVSLPQLIPDWRTIKNCIHTCLFLFNHNHICFVGFNITKIVKLFSRIMSTVAITIRIAVILARMRVVRMTRE